MGVYLVSTKNIFFSEVIKKLNWKTIKEKMAKLLTGKQGGSSFSLVDAGLTSGVKVLGVDGVVTPLINRVSKGNVFLNVAGKVIGASMTGRYVGGKFGKITADAMILSAGDELIETFLGRSTSVPAGNAEQAVGAGVSDSFGGSNKTGSSGEVFI